MDSNLPNNTCRLISQSAANSHGNPFICIMGASTNADAQMYWMGQPMRSVGTLTHVHHILNVLTTYVLTVTQTSCQKYQNNTVSQTSWQTTVLTLFIFFHEHKIVFYIKLAFFNQETATQKFMTTVDTLIKKTYLVSFRWHQVNWLSSSI